MACQYPVKAVCDALGVSRTGYYAHRRKPARARRRADAALAPRVRAAFEVGRHAYGSPRVWAQLRREGVRCGRNRVARLMREQGLRAVCKRRHTVPRTTDSRHSLPVAPNWLASVPKPDKPNQIWTSDITYLPTGEGWLFLAGVMDLYSRRIVGWAVAPTLHSALATKALERAITARGCHPGLIHHSDRGCQYASHDYRLALGRAAITQSMSRKGNCYDNAAMESFFATLKTETPVGQHTPTRKAAENTVFDYIETFYNTRRIHTALDYKSPVEFERQTEHQSKINQTQNTHISLYALST
jgi:putative transposase